MEEDEENDEETQLVKVTWKNPNPLFVKWITEWLEEARKRNMQLQYNLEKALESLKKFPLPLKSGKECLILEHFGTGLCLKLDRELEKYKLAKLQPAGGVPKAIEPAAIPGPSTSGIRLANKDPVSILEHPIKRENESTNEIVPKNDDKPSPKKLPQVEKTSKVQSVCIESVTLRSLRLAGQSTTEINFTKKGVEKNVNLVTPADLEIASDAATTCFEDLTVKSRKQTARSPAKRKYAESPQKNAFSPKKSSSIGIASNVASTSTDTLTFEAKRQIIRLSPAKRKQTTRSPKKSPPDVSGRICNTAQAYSSFKNNGKSSYKHGSGNALLARELRLVKDFAWNSAPPVKLSHTEISRAINKKPVNPGLSGDDDSNTASLSQISSVGSCSQSVEEAFTFVPGEFSIKLLVDTAETFGHTSKRSRREEEATAYLTELGVPFEVRHLTVGDFVWVCHDGTAKELLLPYIVERKRADDLAKSIKDGRFKEQKFRLKQLPVAERIYLVEELKKKEHSGIPLSTLMQAATNTQVVDGFKVKFTTNLKHSMQYLATMTEYLSETFSKKILASCRKDELPPFNMKDDLAQLMTFKDFTRDSGKKRKYTVGEMFLKHLLQLKGMSVEKAKALVAVYPTPTHLMEAYRDYSAADKRMMLSKLKIGPLGRSFGPVLSGAIHDFYTKNKFD